MIDIAPDTLFLHTVPIQKHFKIIFALDSYIYCTAT